MSKTISSIYTSQYNLAAGGNPLTITSTGGVETPGATAITGNTARAWTVANAGTVIGSYGIELAKGGLVTNTGSIIATYEAVQIRGAAGTVSNSGKIIGGSDGVVLFDGGTVTNLAGGTIAGSSNVGVYLSSAAATLTNAGTISGGNLAVYVKGGITSRIIVDPGAVFIGKVQGGTGSNTLELARGTGSTGTIGGIGTQFVGFGTIDIDPVAAWSLVNAGALASGTTLLDNGTLTTSGTISGSLSLTVGAGYDVSGATATNNGTLTNTGTVLIAGGSGGGFIPAGGAGGALTNNGVLINSALISISGGAGGHNYAKSGSGGQLVDAGILTNAGTIELAGGGPENPNDLTGGYGAGLVVSGTLANSGSIGIAAGDPGQGNLKPGYAAAVTITSTGTLSGAGSVNGAGSLFNYGGIGASGAIALGYLLNDGVIGSSATLTDAGTLVNKGSIVTGVTLAADATLDNAGQIYNVNSFLSPGVYGGLPTSIVTNSGEILGHIGISLLDGGVVTNMSGASITGIGFGGVFIEGASGTVTNDGGTIVGAYAIDLSAGGTVSNLPTGLLLGTAANAVYVKSGTVINAGTIIGTSVYDAVDFGGTANRLVIDPGAVFTGAVLGGSGSNTLELAAGAAGTIGTISGLGTQFLGFQAIDVDAGASWSLTNPGSIAAGVTLAAGATLYNAAAVSDASSTYAVIDPRAQNAVTNSGTITGRGGVGLFLGGAVTNTGGTITGTTGVGVFIGNSPGTVINDGGRIVGDAFAVDLDDGGTISNLSGGVLLGGATYSAAYIDGGIGTIINAGTITGGYGAILIGGGTISNVSGALLDGTSNVGADIEGGSGTIINAGTIVGNAAHQAVSFGGTYTDRLIVDPGAVFTGAVQGGSGSNTLELAQGTAGNIGTISGIGTQFLGFQTIDVDAGADWAFNGSDTLGSAITIDDAGSMIFSERLGRTVTVGASLSGSGGVVQSGPGRLLLTGSDSFTGGVTLAGGTLELSSGNGAAGHGITFAGAGTVRFDGLATGTIHGFANTDTIDLPSYSYVSGAQATLAAGNTLVVQTGAATFDLLLDPNQDFAGVLFSVQQDAATGILVEETSAPCYARGTHLLTAQGEIAIEALQIGDLVMTASGALRAIRWIGQRGYAGGTIAGNRDILPIRIRAGALADGVPRRDLLVSPKHAMFLDGVLIPAELLVNGVSILQPEHVDALTYYHVELDSHDVLIAEGALSESFIDHDSRVMFDNAAAFRLLHPARREDCAPRVEDGEVLARVRQRLAARAGLGADHADDAAMEGPLDGRLDLLDASGVAGWAFDARRPHTPIRLDVLDGARVIGTVVANRFRPDLGPAGKGDGRCAYVFRFDGSPADLGGISLRRSSDGALLPALEAVLRAA